MLNDNDITSHNMKNIILNPLQNRLLNTVELPTNTALFTYLLHILAHVLDGILDAEYPLMK